MFYKNMYEYVQYSFNTKIVLMKSFHRNKIHENASQIRVPKKHHRLCNKNSVVSIFTEFRYSIRAKRCNCSFHRRKRMHLSVQLEKSSQLCIFIIYSFLPLVFDLFK